MPEITETAKWALGILAGILGYFLRDAHNTIKRDVAQKVDKQQFSDSITDWHDQVNAMEKRNKETIERMERQYDVKFAGVVNQFTERMNNIEKNLSEKMDLIRELMSKDRP